MSQISAMGKAGASVPQQKYHIDREFNAIAYVKESLILRQFCRLYFQALPDQSTLIRWAHEIRECL